MADDDAELSGNRRAQATTGQTGAPSQAGVRRARRRSAYATRDLTKGSIPGNLWFLSWPQIAEGKLSVLDSIADLIWAGRLGFEAIAGMGVAQTYIMLIMTSRMGLDTGMRTMIARAVGLRDVAHANHVLAQSLTLATLFALLAVLVGVFLTEPLLRIYAEASSLDDVEDLLSEARDLAGA